MRSLRRMGRFLIEEDSVPRFISYSLSRAGRARDLRAALRVILQTRWRRIPCFHKEKSRQKIVLLAARLALRTPSGPVALRPTVSRGLL